MNLKCKCNFTRSNVTYTLQIRRIHFQFNFFEFNCTDFDYPIGSIHPPHESVRNAKAPNKHFRCSAMVIVVFFISSIIRCDVCLSVSSAILCNICANTKWYIYIVLVMCLFVYGWRAVLGRYLCVGGWMGGMHV